MAPSEYWRACPDEVAIYIKENKPAVYFGNLHEDDAYRLAAEIENDDRFI